MRYSTFICALLASATASADPLPVVDSLRAFESRLRDTPAFRSARPSTYAAMPHRSRLERALPGAALFASTAFASVDEVVDIGRSRSYDQAALSAGLRIPLLGSRARRIEELEEAALSEASAAADLELRRRDMVTLVRQAYVDYWSANERRRFADTYLADRAALQSILVRRTAAGLLLESDRLEFMASFANVATELARADVESRAAASILATLTTAQPAAQIAPFATIQESCISFDVDAHPEIRALAARAAYFEHPIASTPLQSIQSELRLGYTRTEEMATRAPGRSAFVSMTFDYAFNDADNRARAERMRREGAAQQLALRRQQLEFEIERLRTSRTLLAHSVHLGRHAREAAEAKYRERSLRAAKLAGDVIEQLQQARYALYRARLAEHAATREQWEWRIAASAFEDSSCYDNPHPGADVTVSVNADSHRGVYVWSPAQLLSALDTPTPQAVWQRLEALKVRRLLLSFNRTELTRFQAEPRRLAGAIEALQARGFSVEWLLGEPTWMLESERNDLLDLVDGFAGLRFDTIHLDLEPNQLAVGDGDGREHLAALLQTLRAVRAKTPSPIGLSIHPRYMTMPVGDRAFGEHLAALNIEPTLMIYVANPNRVVEIAEALRARWPDLPQRIAVSLEHELDEHHSVEHLSAEALEEHLATLERRLSGGAFRGLVLQPSPEWLYTANETARHP
jgi:hypothetical protein